MRQLALVAEPPPIFRASADGERLIELVVADGRRLHVHLAWDPGDPLRAELVDAVLELARTRAGAAARAREAELLTRVRRDAIDLRVALSSAEDRAHQATERAERAEERAGDAERMLVQHQRFTAMSAMCASVAHDIRSPLTALVWNLRVLEERTQQHGIASDPEIDEVFQDTRLACDLIEGILEGLRTFASGSGAPRLFDAHHVLVTTMRLFRWHISQRGVRFQQHMETDLGAWGTPGEVCQILLNLLANAADASPRGGMVRLDARRMGDGVSIRVSDEGPGIALSESEAVFEPFHTTKQDGLGIGLSVSRAMARRHGGDLVVVTSPRQVHGACLELRLRAAAPPSE